MLIIIQCQKRKVVKWIMGLIYMAKNKINGHMYIGKTDYTLEKRKKQHIQESKREKRRNKISGAFHIALVKYGEENFEWIILEDNIDKTMLNDKEKYYIKKYNTYENKEHYNLTPGGDGGKFDESVRQKISKKIPVENGQMNKEKDMVK